jgi:hypothetical protein
MDVLVEVELKDALALPGCGLCRIGEGAARRYLRFLLHESVNDVAVRARLIAAWGFCRRHAWHFLRFEAESMHDGLSTATLGEGLIEAVQHALGTSPAPHGNGRPGKRERRRRLQALRQALAPQAGCPACDQQRQAETYSVSVLTKLLTDVAWRERVATSEGLCVPHLRLAVTEAESEAIDQIDWLLDDHRRRLARLLGDLKEYIRKHDYRFADEPPGAEADAFRRATALLAGLWFELPGRRESKGEPSREAPHAHTSAGGAT